MTNLKDLLQTSPKLFKIMLSHSKAYIRLYKKIKTANLLNKKLTEELLDKAFNNIDAQPPIHDLNVIISNVIYWIRKNGNQSKEVNKFCDKEMQLLEQDIKKRSFVNRTSNSDYLLILDILKKYKQVEL